MKNLEKWELTTCENEETRQEEFYVMIPTGVKYMGYKNYDARKKIAAKKTKAMIATIQKALAKAKK